ncbi:MAG: alanyl-tRNA editing protein [Anaerolineae bacterium]|nr:alanyl-tRNA editing protein [Anaerolineae bacterium]
MTQRLYYTTATLREFTATVVERCETDRGPAVRLDQTAFYPTSGGQPHDTGTLNGIPVPDVWDDENGAIWHLLAEPLHADEVAGAIQWERRFDHMQQHTGQHILSAAFVEVLQATTIGFHLGTAASTIDLDCAQFSWEAAARVENAANRIVFENRQVTIHTVTQDQLHDIPLRKAPKVTGEIRVIWIEGFDASACGGTHVAHTGEVGLIKITGIERYKGGIRVTFLCGGRALQDYRRALDILRETGRVLSVGADEIPAAGARLLDEVKDVRKALNQAQSERLRLEAAHLWETTPEVNGIRRIVAHWDDHDFAGARAIATQLREQPHTLLLLSVAEEKGLRLVCARSDDLTGINAATLLRSALGSLNGQGGGTPTLAQGGAPTQPAAAVRSILHQTLAMIA